MALPGTHELAVNSCRLAGSARDPTNETVMLKRTLRKNLVTNRETGRRADETARTRNARTDYSPHLGIETSIDAGLVCCHFRSTTHNARRQ
jgi:hypothetical protein